MNNTSKQKTCCIYCRRATTNQTFYKSSIQGQKERCIQRAKQLNCKVIEVFVDSGFGGNNINRPNLKRLILKCKKYKPDYVIIADISRLSRNVADYFYLKKLLSLHNTKILFCSQQYLEDDFLAEILTVSLNERYSRNLSQKIMLGHRARREALLNGSR